MHLLPEVRACAIIFTHEENKWYRSNTSLEPMKDMRALHQLAIERPLTDLGIYLTSYCNLACKMCSRWKERERGVSYDRVLSLLEEARSLGATGFHPFGAEIFTREDTLDILSYAENIGFRKINVTSNGNLLLDKQRIERLATLRTLCLSISLDGPREIHDGLRGRGVYDKAVEALRELKKRGVITSIASIIMRQTLDRLTEIVDLAAYLGIRAISMQPYQREIAGLNNDHSLFEFSPEEEITVKEKIKNLMRYATSKKIRMYTANIMDLVPPYLTRGINLTPWSKGNTRWAPSRGCFVPSRLLLVDTSGESYPCFRMLRMRSMGNVHEQSLDKIWHNDVQRELTLLALNRECPGCLASCSDIASYDASMKGGRVVKLLRRAVKRFVCA